MDVFREFRLRYLILIILTAFPTQNVVFYLTVGSPGWARWLLAIGALYVIATSLFYLGSRPRVRERLSRSLKSPWDTIALVVAYVVVIALGDVSSLFFESDIPLP